MRFFIPATCVIGLLGCAPSPGDRAPTNAGAALDGAVFDDRATATGLIFVHENGARGDLLLPEITGGGVALLDYDDDGDLDVYFLQGGSLVDRPATATDAAHNVMYRNDIVPSGRLRFVDVTAAAGVGDTGYGMGAATGDFDNDGDVDLYVTNVGSNVLYRNDGDGRFSDVTTHAGVDDARWSASASFVDYDADGFLDLYVSNYVAGSVDADRPCTDSSGRREYCSPTVFEAMADSLFRNLGDGRFVDVSAAVGLHVAQAAGLGVIAADFDADGRSDIFVANDQGANHLWLNRGDEGFEETGLVSGSAYNGHGMAEASMGVTAGDYDGDGDDDLFMTHLATQTNTLYVNDGTGNFTDWTDRARLGSASLVYTGFGSKWFDYDNDSALDLFIANGAVMQIAERAGQSTFPYGQRNQLFRNTGDGRFVEIGGAPGDPLAVVNVSRGAAFGDIDNDGDVDVLVANNSGPAQLLINRGGNERNWIVLNLRGRDSNRDGIGSRVAILRAGHAPLWRRCATDGSYLSANDRRVHFGLGDNAAPVDVVVVWPNGKRERWAGLTPGRVVELEEGGGQPWPVHE